MFKSEINKKANMLTEKMVKALKESFESVESFTYPDEIGLYINGHKVTLKNFTRIENVVISYKLSCPSEIVKSVKKALNY